MKLLPIAGLAAAAMLSTIAITDALWQGFQNGAPAPWGWGGEAWMVAGMNIGHVVAYVLIALILVVNGSRIDSGGFVRWVRRLLVGTFGLFAVMIIWGLITGSTAESLGVLQVGADILFFALLLLPIILGFALLRRRALLLPAALLAGSLVPVILMFVLSGATLFAHPAYAEVMALFGVALLPFALDGQAAQNSASDTAARSTSQSAQSVR